MTGPGPSTQDKRRLLFDARPLRESVPFRRLWVGTALSSIGSAFTTFAVTLQVFQLTHSSAAVGAVGLARAVPYIVLGLVGGTFADAVDRRRLVLVTSSGMALTSAVLAAQALLDLRQLWLLYTLITVSGVLQAIDTPARRTFLPRLVPATLLPAGVALTTFSFQISMAVGPALAGLLTAAAGLRACYVVDVVSFAAALYGLARLPAMPPLGGVARPGPRAVIEGLRFIRRSPILAGAFLADLDAMILGMPVALFPALNAAHFGGAAQTLGLLSMAPAVGGLVGSGLSGPVGRVARQGRAMLIAVAVWGAAIAGFGLAGTLWVALLLLAVAGGADSVSVIFRSTMVQTATPDRLRGRISGVDFVVGAGGPQVGNVEAGVVATLTSPAISAVSGGLATVLVAGLLRLALPTFARYRAGSDAVAG